MRYLIFALILIGCGGAESTPTPAPSVRSVTAKPHQARDCLRTKTMHSQLQNWAVRARFTQTLEAGQIHKEPMTVLDGVKYRIESCGDSGVVDAGLKIVDGNGDVVGEASGSREPLLEFGPGDWGSLEIVLEQRALQSPGTGAVAIAVQYQRIDDAG